MGNTDAKISDNFVYLAKLPFTKEEINFSKLDRKVKHWLDQLKCLFNSVLDRTVNASNVTGFASLLKVINFSIDKIEFIPPLRKLYKLYRRALLTDRPSAGKYVQQLAPIISTIIITLRQQTSEPIDGPVLELALSKIDDLEEQYLDKFSYREIFIEGLPREVSGATFISSGGEYKEIDHKDGTVFMIKTSVYGIYKTVLLNDRFYIPSSYRNTVPYVKNNLTIDYGSPGPSSGERELLSEWVEKNTNVTQYGNWYHFDKPIFLLQDWYSGELSYYVGANSKTPVISPELKIFDIGTHLAYTIKIYNNTSGVKFNTSDSGRITIYNSEGRANTAGRSPESYSDLFPITPINTFQTVDLGGEKSIMILGAYGYLIYNSTSNEAKLEAYKYLSGNGGINNLNHYTLP